MTEQQIGPYRILGKLAAGGMATVYVGKHVRLEHVVAVKILHPHLQQEDQVRTRFVDEAKIQANMRHPNILSVQDILELPDASAMVMELLTGAALDVYYRSVGLPLTPQQVVSLFLPLLEALALAHDQGVVHRDLKPSNIFLHCQGGNVIPKLMDFGIAKLQTMAVESQVTAAGSMLGTPQYMAPEQFEDSSKVDARADQFALGVMLYEASLGRLPFTGDNIAEIMKGILTRNPEPARTINPELPESLEAIITRCLQKDREQRFPDVRSLAQAIVALGDEIGSGGIDADSVPLMDLREKGIDITTQITSSKQTRSYEHTSEERPETVATTTAPDESDDKESEAVVDPMPDVSSSPPGKSRAGWIVLGIIIALAVVVGAIVLFLANGKKKKQPKAAGTAAVSATDSTKKAVAKKAVTPPPEVVKVPPLALLPSMEGLQLGSSCNPDAKALVEKVINARLAGGWRGYRLSKLPEEQLNQLGLTLQEQEEFRAIRKDDALVREVDRQAIAASVIPFKKASLTSADLETLKTLLTSPELQTYVKTKKEFLCRSLPLTVAGNDRAVGAMYKEILVAHSLDRGEFSRLDGIYNSNRLVASEIGTRAVCCLLAGEEMKKLR